MLLKKSIVLMVILASLVISKKSYADEINFSIDLPKKVVLLRQNSGLYKPELKLSDSQLIAYTGKEYADILIMYNTFKTLKAIYPKRMQELSFANEKSRKLELKISNLEDSLLRFKYGLGTCIQNRELLMDMYEESANFYNKNMKKKKIRTILIGIGSGAAGIVVGIIAGFIIFR